MTELTSRIHHDAEANPSEVEHELGIPVGQTEATVRFRAADHFKRIQAAIVNSLKKHGLVGHRADDKVYPQDDDLWNNLCVYMMGCQYGIAVFEDFKFLPDGGNAEGVAFGVA